MTDKTLTVEGMNCASCAAHVEKAAGKVAGISFVSVNLATGRMTVSYDERNTSVADIMAAVDRAGYKAVDDEKERKAVRPETELLRKRLVWSLLFTIPLLIITMSYMAGARLPDPISPDTNPLVFALIQLLLTTPVVAAGGNFYIAGTKTLSRGNPGMDTLVAMGTAAAFMYSLYATVRIAGGETHHVHHLYYESAAAILTQTRSGLFPQVGYQGNAGRQRISEGSATSLPPTVPNPQTAYEALLGASWELDLWGRIRRLSESARASALATEEARRGVILSLVASVATSYLQLRALDYQREIAQRTLATYAESVRLFELQFKYGQISQLTLEQARSQYEAAAAAIPQIERDIAQTENAISLLLGRNPGAVVRGKALTELALPGVPAGVPSQLLERRPDIAQAEQQLIAANAQIGAARAQYFPTISLTGVFGSASGQLSDLFSGPARAWSYAGAFAGPIFTGGLISGQVAQAEASQQAALINYQAVIQSAFADVENALVSREKFEAIRELIHSAPVFDGTETRARITEAVVQREKILSTGLGRGVALAHGTTDAGGTGLNLQAADCVINFELPWNPARLHQRIGRVSRIGQQSSCINVVNLIAKDSIEEKIFAGIQLKTDLFKGVFDGEGDKVEFSREKRTDILNQLRERMGEEPQPVIGEGRDQEEIPEDTPHFLNPEVLAEDRHTGYADEEPDIVAPAGPEVESAGEDDGSRSHHHDPDSQSAEKMEQVLNQGMSFISGLLEMATGRKIQPTGEDGRLLQIDATTGEVTMKFKLPGF